MSLFDVKCLRYYVPFYFDPAQAEAVKERFSGAQFVKSNGKTDKTWTASSYRLDKNPDIYGHIQKLMNVTESPDSILTTFGYNMRHLSVSDQNDKTPFTLTDGKLFSVTFGLDKVFAHLFTTGIGFLTYDVVFPQPPDRDRLYAFQEQFRELSHDKKKVGFIRDCGFVRSDSARSLSDAVEKSVPADLPPESLCKSEYNKSEYNEKAKRYEIKYWVSYRMGDLIKGIMDTAGGGIRFFSEGASGIPDKAILMSYIICNDEDQKQTACVTAGALKMTACHMARGYDMKYHIGKSELDACLEMFENVCAYVSAEGCCVAVHPTDDNRRFFVDNPPSDRYAFIHFLTLYQHYSMLRFSDRIENEFPSDAGQYRGSADYADKMERLITEINAHLMKSDFGTVSHITQHNVFYMYCKKALFISEDIQNLNGGFASLMNLQKDIQQSLEQEQRQQAQMRHQLELEAEADREDHLTFVLTAIAIFISVVQSAPILIDLIVNLIAGIGWIDKNNKVIEVIADGVKLCLYAVSLMIVIVKCRKHKSYGRKAETGQNKRE